MTRRAAGGLGIWLTFEAVLCAVWLGFVLHHSGGEGLVAGRWTASYAGFLAALTLVWLAFSWWGWRQRAMLSTRLRAPLLSAGITLLLAALVLPWGYIRLHQKSLEAKLLKPLPRNAHAFFQLDETPDPPAAPDALRVLALGGSTTWGSSLARDEAYPARLQAHLRARFTGREIVVVNAGVPWHTSMHSLLRYVGRFADWRPHAVIVMHAFNDIFQSSEGRLTNGPFRRDYGHFFGAFGERANPRDRLNESLARLFRENWLARTWYSDLREMPVAAVKPRVDLLAPLPSFERNLRELARRGTQDGTRVVIATQPFVYHDGIPQDERRKFFYRTYYADYAEVPTMEEQRAAMLAFNATARRVSAEGATALVDLEAAIPKTREMMYDDVHYTREGADRVARVFVESLPWEEWVSLH